MVVTVFQSSGPGEQDGSDIDDINLRAAVYFSKLAAYAEVSIKGFQDLRQVMTDTFLDSANFSQAPGADVPRVRGGMCCCYMF